MRKTAALLFSLFIFISIGGCRRSQFKGVDFVAYKAPTLVATVVNTPTVSPITPMPTSADVNCVPYLTYLEDVTVPDGTTFVPGDLITKTWLVQNTGSCAWTDKFSLRHIDGSLLDADSRQELPPLEPGEEGEVTVTFNAPQTGSEYRSYYWSGWQAYDASGNAFGDDIYMEIYVDPYHTIDESQTETQGETADENTYGY